MDSFVETILQKITRQGVDLSIVMSVMPELCLVSDICFLPKVIQYALTHPPKGDTIQQ